MNAEDLINNFNFRHLKFKIWSADAKIPNCIVMMILHFGGHGLRQDIFGKYLMNGIL